MARSLRSQLKKKVSPARKAAAAVKTAERTALATLARVTKS